MFTIVHSFFYILHSGEIKTCDSNIASPVISYVVLDRGIPFKTRVSIEYLFTPCGYIVHTGSRSHAKVEHSYEIFHEPKWCKQAKEQLSLVLMEIFLHLPRSKSYPPNHIKYA